MHTVQQHKLTRASKFDDHAELGMYLGTHNGLCRIFVPKTKRMVQTKYEASEETE